MYHVFTAKTFMSPECCKNLKFFLYMKKATTEYINHLRRKRRQCRDGSSIPNQNVRASVDLQNVNLPILA